ncbi:VOC family protein [Sorangium sp. So ce315]
MVQVLCSAVWAPRGIECGEGYVDAREPRDAALRAEGCNVLDKNDDSEYGKFAWVIDPEGNKVELWQPPAGQ